MRRWQIWSLKESCKIEAMLYNKDMNSATSVKNLERFAGKWVAFLDRQVIESGGTLPSLMEKLKRKKFKQKPSVMLVPRKDEGPYILGIL